MYRGYFLFLALVWLDANAPLADVKFAVVSKAQEIAQSRQLERATALAGTPRQRALLAQR